jgi:hypothetical protein
MASRWLILPMCEAQGGDDGPEAGMTDVLLRRNTVPKLLGRFELSGPEDPSSWPTRSLRRCWHTWPAPHPCGSRARSS